MIRCVIETFVITWFKLRLKSTTLGQLFCLYGIVLFAELSRFFSERNDLSFFFEILKKMSVIFYEGEKGIPYTYTLLSPF